MSATNLISASCGKIFDRKGSDRLEAQDFVATVNDEVLFRQEDQGSSDGRIKDSRCGRSMSDSRKDSGSKTSDDRCREFCGEVDLWEFDGSTTNSTVVGKNAIGQQKIQNRKDNDLNSSATCSWLALVKTETS